MSEFAYETARGLLAKLRAREISSLELLEYFLARIERLNPALNAVITLDAERAREAAAEADAARARGEIWGPLHGLPMTIKDAFEVRDLRTTSGAKLWAEHVPKRDAIAVQRLRAAGAIFMGKTNVPSFCADLQTYNEIFGTTNNPWDVSRTPGGSSGGAAAALAAGLTPLELGSDIGGSIRTPANWCGVVGHKPSYGIIPHRGHLPPFPGALADNDLSVVGPLARCVDDLALLFSCVIGPPPEQQAAYSLQLPPPRATRLRGYRVACWFSDAAAPLDGAVRAQLEAAVASLRRAGVEVTERHPEVSLVDVRDLYRMLLDPIMARGMPEATLELLPSVADRSDLPPTLTRFARNASRTHREWLDLNERRAGLRQRYAKFFEEYDVLLCPVSGALPIPHDHREPLPLREIRIDGQLRPYTDLFTWIAPATACHLPATVIPVGRDAGLPVGIQIVAPYLEDRTALDFAGRMSELIGGFERPPGY